MKQWLFTQGEWLSWQCVDFMINIATLLGVTYRDANAGLFFVIWPLVTLTLTLALCVCWNVLTLYRLILEKQSNQCRLR